LIDAWSDAEARAVAADNLFLDEALEDRRAAIGEMRRSLGTCASEPVEAENALRGTFRMSCEGGWLSVDLTLAPTQPPAVQHLEVTSGRPPTSTMRESIASVLDAMSRGPRALELTRSTDRAAIGALLAATRERYGSCRMGKPQEGDGDAQARVRLECDGGPLDLTVTKARGRIESLQLEPPDGAACTL
jgi:hypothetical protein